MNENKVEKPFKNIIDDRKRKEEVGDIILAYLTNQNLIGYLFQDNDNNIVTLVKVETPSRLFKKNKTFFVAYQENKLMLLTNGFDYVLFKKTSEDMLKMHNVDINSLNKKDYFMELY